MHDSKRQIRNLITKTSLRYISIALSQRLLRVCWTNSIISCSYPLLQPSLFACLKHSKQLQSHMSPIGTLRGPWWSLLNRDSQSRFKGDSQSRRPSSKMPNVFFEYLRMDLERSQAWKKVNLVKKKARLEHYIFKSTRIRLAASSQNQES